MNICEQVKKCVNQLDAKTRRLEQEVWQYAELNFREYKSARAIAAALENEGFTVKHNAGGMKTAFVAEYGEGLPVIAFLGEYDALSGLSQKAELAEKQLEESGENGHGCGHNLLGAGSFAAAAAVKKYIEENKIKATVRYYGCPAEEDGGGKTHIAKAGLFNDVDAAFTWHPSVASYVVGNSTLAVTGVLYSFKGVSAHAAANPFAGRSALDAAELMSVGCNYLREHIIPEARLHYAYRDVGGLAPNVVQPTACVHYYIRAPRVKQMLEIKQRVDDVARGAALMTGTDLEITVVDGVSDYIPNKTLSELLTDCMKQVGAPEFDKKDYELAQKFANTVNGTQREENLAHEYDSIRCDKDYFAGKVLDDNIAPLNFNKNYAQPGSTDVGDTSYTCPTAQCNYACVALGTGGHSWQMTAQSNSSIGHKGTMKAAQAMALAAITAILNPDILQRAREDYKKDVPDGYTCPMPDGVKPEF